MNFTDPETPAAAMSAPSGCRLSSRSSPSFVQSPQASCISYSTMVHPPPPSTKYLRLTQVHIEQPETATSAGTLRFVVIKSAIACMFSIKISRRFG